MSFDDVDGAKRWVKESSTLSASILASRAASRGLPIIFNNKNISDDEILRVFRGMHAGITASSASAISPDLEAALVSASKFTLKFSDFAHRACLVATRDPNQKSQTGKNVDSYYAGRGSRSEDPQAIAASASDARAIDIDQSDALEAPLWRDLERPSWFSNGWADGSQLMLRNSQIWTHWVTWYEDLIGGNPIDWELQRQVALIGDAVWEGSPETVASEIEKINAMIVTQKANTLLIEHVEQRPAELVGIGHNNPPEGINDFPIINYELSQLTTTASVIQSELEASVPDRSKLQSSLEILGKVLASFAKWFGRKLDISLEEFLKTLSKSSAVAISGVAGTWLLGLHSNLGKLIEALSKYIGMLP